MAKKVVKKRVKAAKPKNAKAKACKPCKEADNLAIASLICGVLCFFLPLLNIIAIVLGIVALGHIKKNPNLEGKNYAIAGIVLGSLSVIIGLIVLLFIFSILGIVFSAIAASAA